MSRVLSSSRSGVSRRHFLQTGTSAAMAFPFIARNTVLGANGRLNVGGVGVGGKGWGDITSCDSENIIGLCDTDSTRLAKARETFGGARGYSDWRVMFDQLGRELDAIVVSTPDHTHFPVAYQAILQGKHCYCQKPLTHTVWEARTLTEAARRTRVATQMGNQGMSHPALQREAEVLRAGAIGRIREIHIWTDRPGKWWKQGLPRPIESLPVPGHLAWNDWLGVAPERPYAGGYHGFHWRGRWDFGTGALGDMGCHLFNLATLVFPLTNPSRVSAESVGGTDDSPPLSSIVRWEFPATRTHGPVRVIWYDGDRRPPTELFQGKLPSGNDNGVLMIGDKDTLLTSYIGEGRFMSGARIEDFASAPELFPKRPGWERSHYEEWIAAAKGGPKPVSNFEVAGPVTEAVLLGNVAIRSGVSFQWNPRKLKTDRKEADRWITKAYRKGWGL